MPTAYTPEGSGPQPVPQKPAKPIRAIDAFQLGANNQPLPSPEKPGTGFAITRIAHKLGKRAYEHSMQVGEQETQARREELREVWEQARGINQQLFTILDHASSLTRVDAAQILRPHWFTDKDRARFMCWRLPDVCVGTTTDGLISAGGVRERQSIPVIGDTLGTLHMASLEPGRPNNEYSIPILAVSATIASRQGPRGQLEAPTSTFFFNEATYRPDLPAPHTAGPASVKLEVGPDGTILQASMTNQHSEGYRIFNVAGLTTNISDVLAAVDASVLETLEAYQEIRDGLSEQGS